jgi:hypothetical protein
MYVQFYLWFVIIPFSLLALWPDLKPSGMSWIRDLLCSILEDTQDLFEEICESNGELGWHDVGLYVQAGHILSTEDVNYIHKSTLHLESYKAFHMIKFKTLCPVVSNKLPVHKATAPLTFWQEGIIETCLINVQKFIHLNIRRYTHILQQSLHRNNIQGAAKQDGKVISRLNL